MLRHCGGSRQHPLWPEKELRTRARAWEMQESAERRRVWSGWGSKWLGRLCELAIATSGVNFPAAAVSGHAHKFILSFLSDASHPEVLPWFLHAYFHSSFAHFTKRSLLRSYELIGFLKLVNKFSGQQPRVLRRGCLEVKVGNLMNSCGRNRMTSCGISLLLLGA